MIDTQKLKTFKNYGVSYLFVLLFIKKKDVNKIIVRPGLRND
jgi:hypothetical protein